MTKRKQVAAFAFAAAFFQIIEFVLAFSSAGPIVAPGASAAAIRKYGASHAGGILWLLAIDVLATIAVTAFVWNLRGVLRDSAESGALKWLRESLIALVAYIVVNGASDAVQFTVVTAALSDAAIRVLYGIYFVLQEAALFPLAILLIVLASDLRRAALVPDWQARWGLIAGVFLLIGELWIFTSDPFLASMIQSFTISGSLGFVVWMSAIGISMLVRNTESTGK